MKMKMVPRFVVVIGSQCPETERKEFPWLSQLLVDLVRFHNLVPKF